MIQHKFFSKADFNGVSVKWCEPLHATDTNGMAPAPGVVLLTRMRRHADAELLAPLLGHEMFHLRQMKRPGGYDKFTCDYSKEILAGHGTKCSTGNTLECEAYNFMDEIEKKIHSFPQAYFISGGEYVGYDKKHDKAFKGYPRPLKDNWPGVWADRVDAGVNWRNGKVYLFRGAEYIRYDLREDKSDAGYPKPIKGHWRGLWETGVDAAVNWGNGKVYFFKGPQYVRFDVLADKADAGYPKPIKGNWPGLWESGVDEGINWRNGKVYFFKGGEYVRYDVKADKVDAGYPKPIKDNWPGLWETGVSAAVEW